MELHISQKTANKSSNSQLFLLCKSMIIDTHNVQTLVIKYQCQQLKYCIAGKFGKAKFGEFTHFEHLAKKVWRMNRFNQKVIIVSRNLDGFSLENQE